MSDKVPYFINELERVFERICFVYWLFTVPFYIVLEYTMIHAQKKKIANLASSFYKICIVAGIVDIVTLLNIYFGEVFPSWGWFTPFYLKLGKAYVYMYLIIAWGSGINQALSVSIMAANRLSAIMFPQHYQEACTCLHRDIDRQLWSGNRLKIAMAIQIVPGYTIPLLFLRNEVGFKQRESGGLLPTFIDNENTTGYFIAAGIFLSANSIFLVLSYCCLFYVLHRRNKMKAVVRTASRRDHNHEMRSEYRLFFMASTIVAVQLLFLLFVLLEIFPFITLVESITYLLYNPLSNLYAGVSAYLLWIFSDDLRHYVYIILRIRKRAIHSTITVTSQF